MSRELILIFHANDGDDAKRIAAARRNGVNHVMVRDIREYRFNEAPERCSKATFTDGVSTSARNDIERHYRQHYERQLEAVAVRRERQDFAPEPEKPPTFEQADTRLTYKHLTQGRWYVMRGKERVSGPHSKTEAKQLAEQGAA